jgi:hypothetical protein
MCIIALPDEALGVPGRVIMLCYANFQGDDEGSWLDLGYLGCLLILESLIFSGKIFPLPATGRLSWLYVKTARI